MYIFLSLYLYPKCACAKSSCCYYIALAQALKLQLFQVKCVCTQVMCNKICMKAFFFTFEALLFTVSCQESHVYFWLVKELRPTEFSCWKFYLFLRSYTYQSVLNTNEVRSCKFVSCLRTCTYVSIPVLLTVQFKIFIPFSRHLVLNLLLLYQQEIVYLFDLSHH